MVILGGTNAAGRRRVPGEMQSEMQSEMQKAASHAPPCCEGQGGPVSSSAVLRFNHLHRRLVPEGWWRFDVLIKEEKGIFTKINLVGVAWFGSRGAGLWFAARLAPWLPDDRERHGFRQAGNGGGFGG